jgi:hypothetical protein
VFTFVVLKERVEFLRTALSVIARVINSAVESVGSQVGFVDNGQENTSLIKEMSNEIEIQKRTSSLL